MEQHIWWFLAGITFCLLVQLIHNWFWGDISERIYPLFATRRRVVDFRSRHLPGSEMEGTMLQCAICNKEINPFPTGVTIKGVCPGCKAKQTTPPAPKAAWTTSTKGVDMVFKDRDFYKFKEAICQFEAMPNSKEARQTFDNWRRHCFTTYPVGEVLKFQSDVYAEIRQQPIPRSKFPRRWLEVV